MKEIKAIFRHERLEAVRDSLDKIGAVGMTITEVKGAGHQRGYTESYRGATATIHFRPKIELLTVVEDDLVQTVIENIAKNAYTGEVGDGKIFIKNVEEVVRIRTKEHGTKAL